MAGLAGIAIKKGYKVTGQDKAYYPPMSLQLKKMGIKENNTEDVIDEINECDAVIIGNSQSRGNTSVEYVLTNNISYYSGPEWLKNNILKNKYVFVISGTHGKTTTTSLLIKILKENNKDPSFLLGGIDNEENTSFKYSDSKYFVIEGDEYDTAFFDKRSKFIHYKPNTLIINNLEFDHSDIFKDLGEIIKQFHFLLRTMSSKENIVFNQNDSNIKKILDMGCWSRQIPFIKNPKITNIFGDHNLKNCAAAITAAKTIGISESDSEKVLKSYRGVKRRLELISFDKFILYDDFAHHPTEIKASLKALRMKYKNKKIISFFEIRSNSMIAGTHKKDFFESFKDSDEIYIYCKNNVEWLETNKDINFSTNLEKIISKIIKSTEIVDIVILMSNGDTSDIIKKITKNDEK